MVDVMDHWQDGENEYFGWTLKYIATRCGSELGIDCSLAWRLVEHEPGIDRSVCTEWICLCPQDLFHLQKGKQCEVLATQ